MERAPTHGAFADQLRNMEFEELLHVAKQVRELQAQPGWEFIQRLVQEREEKLLAHFYTGQVLPHADYIARSAEVTGLREARDCAHTVLYVAEERDAEEKQKAERAAREEQ